MQQSRETQIASLRETVRRQVDHSREKRACYRAFCLLMILQGHRTADIATALGEHARTIERWRKRFNDQGVSGLIDETSPGRPPRLSEKAMASLVKDIQAPPRAYGFDSARWHGKQLQALLHDRYRVEMSLRQCQRLLKRLTAGAPP